MSKDTHFLFYTEHIQNNALFLDSDEVAHIANVLRFKEGDELRVTDGIGTLFNCRIEKLKRDSALCAILQTEEVSPRTPQLTAYIGIPDREKFDTLCEQLPPLNVSTIVPVMTEHCRKPWWDNKWEKHQERFKRKAVASMKQSLNPFLTTITKPITFQEALEQAEGIKLYGNENGSSLNQLNLSKSEADYSLFVGPPGGFSSDEKEQLETQKFIPMALAPYRLRTELAAVAGISLLNQLYLD